MHRPLHLHLLWSCALIFGPCGDLPAQILPPIPPPPTPGEEYIPPKTPPQRILNPADDEQAAPSIVVRNPDGTLKIYADALDEVVIAIYPFDPQRRARVDLSAAARRAEIERFVVDHLDLVLTALQKQTEVDAAKDFASMLQAASAAQAIAQESLADRLQREGSISALQRVRIRESVQQYETARRDQWTSQANGDPMAIATRVGKQSFADTTRGAFAALNSLVAAATLTLEQDAADLALDTRQQAELRSILAQTDQERRGQQARSFILQSLSLEQQRKLLKRHVSQEIKPPQRR